MERMDVVMGAGMASATVKSEFEARRAALREVQLRNPNGKLAKKAGVLMLDMDAFDDRVAECGGDEGFLYFLTAQVASGVTLKEICDHYCLEYGLLWAWMGAQPERLARYEIALRGLADAHISEMVPIADAATPESLAVDQHRTKVRREVAGVLDRKRFGVEKAAVGGPTVGSVIDAGLAFAASELLAKLVRPADNMERVVSEQGGS